MAVHRQYHYGDTIMIIGHFVRRRGSSRVAALAAMALLGGCATYTPGGLSAMSATDICELEYMQRPNLSAAGKQAIQAELSRRNDNCGNHAAEVQARFAAFMWRETYGKPDNP
jgi:hypothetical protein